ncbi:hypothetical protein GOB94_12200 [Granulicella sp. 5B5]|uniref:hypothetical protein n=1 Tax=Granulicella sp. 5B5 TaxID=1617967 RepID=UPI0015F4B2C3|nr:hypothetical protein [Granulicella sp. 5B5]QMV19358.1 hypothetical protein GOB94_12200 [Granulicella sp. 5B5]
MWRKSLVTRFKALALYLVSIVVIESIQIPLLFFRRSMGIDLHVAYKVFFYSNEVLAVIQAVLMVAIIYSIFQNAMRPLKGLQRMGTLVFKWVAAVSALLAGVLALGPHVFSTGFALTIAVTTVIERAQEGINVLTLCLLLFVCLAIKPLGLTFRSHVFGVALGLGIISTTELVQAAWFWTSGAHSVYSPIYLFGTIGYIVAMGTWGVYLVIPEPERRMILLPTTSPFFHWNRISEALGDAPGHVAIGFKPSMISPTEVKVMTAMSRAAREREAASVAAESKAQAEMDSIAVS